MKPVCTVYVQWTTWCKSSLTLSPYLMFSNMWRLLWTMACSNSWFWSAQWLIRVRLDKTSGSKFWWCCGRLRNWRSARLTCSWTWTLTRRDTSRSDGSIQVSERWSELLGLSQYLLYQLIVHINLSMHGHPQWNGQKTDWQYIAC